MKKSYIIIILISIFFIFIRIQVVKHNRNQKIISFISEWNKYGKPVTVEKIDFNNFPIYTKFTIINNTDKSGIGFVTRDIKDKLKCGQLIYFIDKEHTPLGTISNINQELDINTGMFQVQVIFNEPIPKLESILVVFALTNIIENVLSAPNNIFDIKENNYYLWKVENNKAKKIQVETSFSNNSNLVINKGVNKGDLIIFKGQNILLENDLVKTFFTPLIRGAEGG